jgi:thiol-disulfide isomerase/thioredoxin
MKKISILIVLLNLSLCSFSQYDVDKAMEKIDTYVRTNNARFPDDTLGLFAGTGTDGKYYSNNSLKNKITFINFWFSNCIPCINEFNDLKKLYEKYHSDFNFQFLSFTFDSLGLVKRTIQKYSLPYNVINLTDQQCSMLNFGKGYPTNFIVDKSGDIVNISTGREIFRESGYFEKNIYPLLDSLLIPYKDQQ